MSRICQKRRGKTKENAACKEKSMTTAAASVPSQVRVFKPHFARCYFHLLEEMSFPRVRNIDFMMFCFKCKSIMFYQEPRK